MAQITKVFKAGNGWGLKKMIGSKLIPFFCFQSVDTKIVNGTSKPQWEILIECDHPIFANMEVKKYDEGSSDLYNSWRYHYKITFDSEKGKEDLNNGGLLGDSERHFANDENISVIPKIGWKLNQQELTDLKNKTSLDSFTEAFIRDFITDFRKGLTEENNKNIPEYKEAEQYLKDVEKELKRITSKRDDRERERERDYSIEKWDTAIRANC